MCSNSDPSTGNHLTTAINRFTMTVCKCVYKHVKQIWIYMNMYNNTYRYAKHVYICVEDCQREYLFKKTKDTEHPWISFRTNNWTCWFRQLTLTEQSWWMLFAILFGHQAIIREKVWSTKVPKYRMTYPKGMPQWLDLKLSTSPYS